MSNRRQAANLVRGGRRQLLLRVELASLKATLGRAASRGGLSLSLPYLWYCLLLLLGVAQKEGRHNLLRSPAWLEV